VVGDMVVVVVVVMSQLLNWPACLPCNFNVD